MTREFTNVKLQHFNPETEEWDTLKIWKAVSDLKMLRDEFRATNRNGDFHRVTCTEGVVYGTINENPIEAESYANEAFDL